MQKLNLLLILCMFGIIESKTKTVSIYFNQPDDRLQQLEYAVNNISDIHSPYYGKYLSLDELINFVNIAEGKYVEQYFKDYNFNYFNFGED